VLILIGSGCGEGVDGGDPLFQLRDRGLRARRAAAETAQLGVDLAVGQPGAVVVRADEAVELAPQLEAALPDRQLARRRFRLGAGGAAASTGRGLLGLATGQQDRYLVR